MLCFKTPRFEIHTRLFFIFTILFIFVQEWCHNFKKYHGGEWGKTGWSGPTGYALIALKSAGTVQKTAEIGTTTEEEAAAVTRAI